MLSSRALTHLSRQATGAPSWDEPALARLLSTQGAPCYPPHLAFERDLHAALLSTGVASGSRFLLSMPGRDFGTQATWADLRHVDPGAFTRRLEDGSTVVLFGRLLWGGALYIGPDGATYRCWADRPPLRLADRPEIYLERACHEITARSERSLELVIPSRGAEALLAAQIGWSSLAETSDGVRRCWGRGSSWLGEGNIDAPTADVTHVYAESSEVRALGSACRALGLGGAIELVEPTTEARCEALRLVEESGDDVVIPYQPRYGRGEGILHFREVNGAARVEQTITAGDWVVRCSRFPEREVVDYTIARGHFPALSPRGRSIARERCLRRDRTLRASPEVLRALLRERGLPEHEAALRVEADLGGFLEPLADDGEVFAFGPYQVLVRDDEVRSLWAATFPSECLEGARDFPRVSYEGEALVPIGTAYREVLYVDLRGRVYVHDWDADTVVLAADRPLAFVERRLLTEWLYAAGMLTLSIPGTVGAAYAQGLGLAPIHAATDGRGAFWGDERTFVSEDHASGLTVLFTPDAEVRATAEKLIVVS